MREVGVISPGKAVSEEPHLRMLTTLSYTYVSSPFGDYGRPRKSHVVTDPARVDADRPKRVVRRTLNGYHSHLMAGPRLQFATDPQGSIQLVARPSNDRFMTPSSRSSPQT
jgi:hypothetical protein